MGNALRRRRRRLRRLFSRKKKIKEVITQVSLGIILIQETKLANTNPIVVQSIWKGTFYFKKNVFGTLGLRADLPTGLWGFPGLSRILEQHG